MFTKTQPAPAPRNTAPAAPQPAAPQPAAAQPAAPRAGAMSLISKDIRIVGDIIGEGELQIDGVVKGQVRVGRLIVGEGGFVEGAILAQLAEVRGRVNGTVTARQVRLYGTSQVEGDITHEQLAMETGAQFVGRSVKHNRNAEAPAAAQPVAQAPAAQAPAPFSGASPLQPTPYPASR
jgi:cytoskeletal protein CcmA (bactofilin family)